MAPDEMPPYHFLQWPVLQALVDLGGSASITDLERNVIELLGISTGVQRVPHGNGPLTELQFRLAWARTYLKGMGLLTNSQRGVWSVTEQGRTITEQELPKLRSEYIARARQERSS